jgi:hypothetical protein
MPKAGGKWNTFEITAKGRDITVVLNGNKTAELRNGMFDEGWIALQHGAGAIKFRHKSSRCKRSCNSAILCRTDRSLPFECSNSSAPSVG